MNANTIIDDLYRYNVWANTRILCLCDGLSDQQLDQPREMGFGTLRNTMFHVLEAEQLWLERWLNGEWRPLATESGAITLGEIERRLHEVDADRGKIVDSERGSRWSRICDYKNTQQVPFRNHLVDLLIHVANHGIHHRAQALNFLKGFGRTTPGGIDYLFFRLARPVIKQEDATAASMRQYGLEVDSGPGSLVVFDSGIVTRYFAYGDWANRKLLQAASQLDDQALDAPFDMGLGSMRKNLLHIQDAERWWLQNWTVGPTPFERAAETMSINQVTTSWQELIPRRTDFIAATTPLSADRVVTALVGPMSVRVMVIESLLQLCGHGTHHRAQIVNMLRHSGVTPPALDYVVWLRET